MSEAITNPFAKRCYTMSESHLSGYRLIVGFERLEYAQDAHTFVASSGRAALSQPAPLAGEVTDEQIDDIVERAGETVGVHHGAWDTVNPRELVRAIISLSIATEDQPKVEHVGDTRFEGWLGCHEPDRSLGRALRYSKQDMRDSYWAGYCEARAILALRPQAVPMTLPQVEGDVLPPVGSKVLIHLASSDSWAEHEVVGYYVWEAINELAKPRHHRVFVRVRDSDGILNARHLCDVRGITAKAEGGA